jgi:hypothetical protein
MNRFKNLLIVAAVFTLLMVIGTVLNTRRVAAQGPPGGMAVNIVNPLPVPVTGATTVSGAVAATQSGIWNVGVTGTANVHVANPATAPVLTLDISKSASQHLQLICGPNYGGCTVPGGSALYVVPAGQNFVVTSVDILTTGGGGNSDLSITTSSLAGGSWYVPNSLSLTQSFQYPSGIMYPAGFAFNSPSVSFSANFFLAWLNGFLTPI